MTTPTLREALKQAADDLMTLPDPVREACEAVTSFEWDRIMSLHHRAYEVIQRGGDLREWTELATRLYEEPIDCPLDTWVVAFWETANAAFDAGLPSSQAFPLWYSLPGKKVLT